MGRRFEGKTVFITGASAGIGWALAHAFAREGANLALAARRKDRLDALCAELEQGGAKALALACDVTDRAQLDEAAARAVEVFGGLDVAVANAGFAVSGTFDRLTTDDFRRQFEVNVFGVLETIYAVLPHLERSRGRLGIVASVAGRVGSPATSAYCSSKFALCGLAECLYHDLAEKGVSVTCINPGFVESDIRITDNQGVVRPERSDPVPAWLVVSAEKAARDIVNALYRRRFEAVITGHGKAIVWVYRHFPRLFRAVTRLGTRGRLDAYEKSKRAKGG